MLIRLRRTRWYEYEIQYHVVSLSLCQRPPSAPPATSTATTSRYHTPQMNGLFEPASHATSSKVNRRRHQRQRRHRVGQSVHVCRVCQFGRRDVNVVEIGLKTLRRRLCLHSSSGRGRYECLGCVVPSGKFRLGQDKIVTFAVFVDGRGRFLMPFVRGSGFLLAWSVLLS